jgi:hypothetical protein
MNDRSTRSVTTRPIKERKKLRSKKQRVRGTDWELTDERLDDALRQTFPAVTRYRLFKMFAVADSGRQGPLVLCLMSTST